MKAPILIVLFGILLIVAGWFFIIKQNPIDIPEPPSEVKELVQSPGGDAAPMPGGSAANSPAINNSAGDPTAQINAVPMPREFVLQTEVRSGQPVVVDVYEGQAGEYILTTLTPQFEDPAKVDVKVDSFRYFLDGEMNDISDVTVNLPEFGFTRHAAPVFTGELNADQSTELGQEYIIELSARQAADAGTIQLNARGSSREVQRPVAPPQATELTE